MGGNLQVIQSKIYEIRFRPCRNVRDRNKAAQRSCKAKYGQI